MKRLKPKNKMGRAFNLLMIESPFFSTLLMRCRWVETEDVETMQTNGRYLLWNPEFVRELTVNQTKWVLKHEAYHIACGHHLRFHDLLKSPFMPTYDVLKTPLGEKVRKLFNVATDLAINSTPDMVKDQGRISNCLMPQDFEMNLGLNAEVYFKELWKQIEDEKQEPEQGEDHGEENSQQENNDQENNEEENHGETGQDQSPGQSESESTEHGNHGNDSEHSTAESDQGSHREGTQPDGDGQGNQNPEGDSEGLGESAGEDADDSEQGQPTDGESCSDDSSSGHERENSGGTGPAEVPTEGSTPTEIAVDEAMENLIGEVAPYQPKDGESEENAKLAHELNVCAAWQAAQKAGESLPSEITKMVGAILDKGEIPWQSALRPFVNKVDKGAQSFERPSRRMCGYRSSVILPDNRKRTVGRITFIQDTSASMKRSDCLRVIEEIHSILEAYPNAEIDVLLFTTEVYQEYTVTSSDRVNVDEWNWRSGGTKIAPAFERAKQLDPDVIVCLTDGEVYDYPNRPSVPTLFLMTGDKVAPFGKSVHFKTQRTA